MRVLTVEDSLDNAVLRASSRDFSIEALQSETFAELARLMVATVTHPSQDGVGIAGPQVGLNRRVVAVQRFDKGVAGADGEMEYPFEVYPNIRITWASDSLSAGPEGCLSLPGRRGEVMRSKEIVVEYADMAAIKEISSEKTKTGSAENIPMIRDTVNGFTAVIFQHEIDHLDGVLYIDRL
jgi:peptide deformylase